MGTDFGVQRYFSGAHSLPHSNNSRRGVIEQLKTEKRRRVESKDSAAEKQLSKASGVERLLGTLQMYQSGCEGVLAARVRCGSENFCEITGVVGRF